MKDGAQESLELKLAKLPRELAPPDNLWPAIVRKIARPPRRVAPLAFASAAAAASACLATALTWAVLHGRRRAHAPRRRWPLPRGEFR